MRALGLTIATLLGIWALGEGLMRPTDVNAPAVHDDPDGGVDGGLPEPDPDPIDGGQDAAPIDAGSR